MPKGGARQMIETAVSEGSLDRRVRGPLPDRHQKEMFENVKSETKPDEIELNVRFLIRAAKAFNIPVILSTVGVQMDVNGPTRPAIQNEVLGIEVIDRRSMDAWEDNAFRAAVKAGGAEAAGGR